MRRLWWKLRWHLWGRWQPRCPALRMEDAGIEPVDLVKPKNTLWSLPEEEGDDYFERLFGGEDGRE